MTQQALLTTYCTSSPGSLRERLILRARRKIYRVVSQHVPLVDMTSILDVGVTADKTCAYSNFFENLFPHPERITAFSDQDASWMCSVWNGLRFVQGDGCHQPFPDASFDLVFSSAVLEHVGSRERQRAFLAECVRVSRRFVVLTTPDRHFPLEMHSGLPLVHWLPVRVFRKILRFVGLHELAKESNLNLLTCDDLRRLGAGMGEPEIVRFKFFGWPSNLLFILEKTV